MWTASLDLGSMSTHFGFEQHGGSNHFINRIAKELEGHGEDALV